MTTCGSSVARQPARALKPGLATTSPLTIVSTSSSGRAGLEVSRVPGLPGGWNPDLGENCYLVVTYPSGKNYIVNWDDSSQYMEKSQMIQTIPNNQPDWHWGVQFHQFRGLRITWSHMLHGAGIIFQDLPPKVPTCSWIFHTSSIWTWRWKWRDQFNTWSTGWFIFFDMDAFRQ